MWSISAAPMSLSVAEVGLLDPWICAGSRMALQRQVLRLGKPPRRWKTPSLSESLKRKITELNIQGRPLKCETYRKSWFYGEDGEQCGGTASFVILCNGRRWMAWCPYRVVM